jgi:uncharacterized protein
MQHLEGPVASTERLYVLDVVRGVALLGILIMNMPGFANSFFAGFVGKPLWPAPIDQAAESLREMLFSGKFNSMFSLLFGIGFTIQFDRLQRKLPEQASRLYLRRVLFLFALGLLHGMVFWTGDILHMYALFGLLLLFVLRHLSDRAIMVLIGLCILYPLASGTLRLFVMTPDVVELLKAQAKAWEASNNMAYGSGSFLAAAREHAREFIYYYDNRWSLWYSLGFYVQIASTMLLGVLIGRHHLPQRINEFLPWVRRLQWGALGLGLATALVFGTIMLLDRSPTPTPLKVLGSFCYVLCRLSMMIFYVLTIVRLLQAERWRGRFAPVAAVGRMPLTNYLAQTLICTTLFYGWGFGLWGQVGPAWQLVIPFVIFFGVQVPFSILWLRRFEYGPMEYLWRLATYGRSQPRALPAAG